MTVFFSHEAFWSWISYEVGSFERRLDPPEEKSQFNAVCCQLNAIKEMFPDKPVTDIDMRSYGMMDAPAVLDKALSLIG